MPDAIADARDLLDDAPHAGEQLAAWLLSLHPLECEAVFPAAVIDAVTRLDGVSASMLNGWLVAAQAQSRRLRGDELSFRRAESLYGASAAACKVPHHPIGVQATPQAPVRQTLLDRCIGLMMRAAARGEGGILVKEHFRTRAERETLRKAIDNDPRLRWVRGRRGGKTGGGQPARVVWAEAMPLFAGAAAARGRADTTG